MSDAKTDYFEDLLIEHGFRGAGALTFPATWYVALFTSDPGEDMSGTEVTGAGYARVATANADTAWNATQNGDGTTSNVATIQYGSPTADWSAGAQITHFALMDAATGGNGWYKAPLQNPITVLNGGNAPSFAAGTLRITES